MDTEAAFDADRTREVFQRVVQNKVGAYVIGNDNEDGQGDGKAVDESRRAEEGERSDPLDRLELATVFDLVGVKQALEAFRQQYGSSQGTDQTREVMQGDGQRLRSGRRVDRRIIVVDSIGPILGPCLGGNAHGQSVAVVTRWITGGGISDEPFVRSFDRSFFACPLSGLVTQAGQRCKRSWTA